MSSRFFWFKKTPYAVKKKNNDPGIDFDPAYFVTDNNFIEDENFQNSKTEFIGKYLSDFKIKILSGLLFVGLALLLGKAVYLQVVKAEYYNNLAEGNRIRQVIIKSQRGMIYDKNNVPLVKNYPIFDVSIVPSDLPKLKKDRENQINVISQIINVAPENIEKILAQYSNLAQQPITIRDNILYEEALSIKIKGSVIPALVIETRNYREYINNAALGHILGYIGKINAEEYAGKKSAGYVLNDYIGKNGLELYYEDILRGQYGIKQVEVDARGNEKKVINVSEAVRGKNIVLAIDYKLQEEVKSIMASGLRRLNKKRGVAIIENVKNGAILSIVSLPDFDNNLFAKGISQAEYDALANNENNPLFDRSVKGAYPPGSTIKPVIGLGALQEKIVTDKTSFMSVGGIRVFDRYFFPDWNLSGHGLTNIYKAIAWSVNTYFYIVGGGYEDFKGLGLDGLLKYFRLAGLGQKTGIDLYGEATGLLPTAEWKKQTKNEDWYIGDTYHISIGQGDLLVTPLQVVNYTAMIANGGTLYQPHLIKSIIDVEKNIVTDFVPKIINDKIALSENVKIIQRAMRETVLGGSAQSLLTVPVAVAGKTGTAQWSSEKGNHAWFTGFAPYDDPQIAITVLVEEGVEGSTAATPIARDILNYYFGQYVDDKN